MDELRGFMGLLTLLSSDRWLPWNPYILASVASEGGFGVSSSNQEAAFVASVGRSTEKRHCKDPLAAAPRLSALSAAGFTLQGEGRRVASEESDAAGEADPSFPEVPGSMLDPSALEAWFAGRWERAEHITLIDARALTRLIAWLAQSTFGHDLRQLHLVGNMAVCLCFSRCRARDFAMLVQVRKLCAFFCPSPQHKNVAALGPQRTELSR